MIYHYMEQHSPEWYDIRAGKITGSIANQLLVKGTTDPSGLGVGAISTAKKIAMERMTGKRMASNNYKSSSMSRGNEFEAIARRKYELQYFVKVKQIGFIESDCGTYGCSPDGLEGDDWLNEIKCFTNPDLHFDLLMNKPSKEIDITQIQFNLFTSERKGLKFISFYPEYEPMPVIMRIFYTDKEMSLVYKKKMELFNNYVTKLMEEMHKEQIKLQQQI